MKENRIKCRKSPGTSRALSISSVCDIIHKVILKYKKNTQAAVILKAILKNRKQTESQVTREERNIVPLLICVQNGFERKLKE